MANYKQDTDKVLVRRLMIGDVEAFEIIYRRYSRELYLLSMAYLNDCKAAEDILQDAFLYLWRKRENLSENSVMVAYLRRIVKSMSLNYLRHNKIIVKHSKIISEEGSDNYTPEEEDNKNSEERELQIQIKLIGEKLKTLPGSCKKIFIMSAIEEMSYKDVSSALGVSVNTIKTQIKIAYRKLRSME